MHKLLAPSNFKDVYTQPLDYSPKEILNLTYAHLEHLRILGDAERSSDGNGHYIYAAG